jgi:hypothetical protein
MGLMAGAASTHFFYLLFISLSSLLVVIPDSTLPKHVEGQNKAQVFELKTDCIKVD